ncbi:MAG: 4Fe-4S binding protein, partial [Methanoregula sp.]
EKNFERKKRPQVDLYKCIRCGLCERHCPTGSIHLEHVHAGTGTDRDVMVT